MLTLQGFTTTLPCMSTPVESAAPRRERLFRIVFESDTRAGKTFDVVLLVCILASVLVIMLDSVPHLRAQYGLLFYRLEWIFTILFTVEYVLRLMAVERPLRYARSFFG